MAILEQRLIAFLDVLGFSRQLQNSSLTDLYNKYSYFISQAKNTLFFENPNDPLKRTNFEYGKFISDSIILISHPTNDIYNINNFLMAISHLLRIGFTNYFPLRGAIGLNDIIIDEDNGIVLSKELPLLLNEEKEQEWTGCTILEDSLTIVLNAIGGENYDKHLKTNPLKTDLLMLMNIPIKSGIKSSYVINFAYGINNANMNKGLEYLIEPKRSNTNNYFQHFKDLPDDPRCHVAENIRVVKTRSGLSLVAI